LDENTYEIDDFPIVNYNTSQLFNINNNPISLIEERNVIKVDEEIKEIDGEEEESFIFSNNNINHQNYSNIVNN
jgi:phenylacetate-coenzyme A ligase PaaK-like adenylate-forming protein